jgi:hypothetical protein
MEARKPGHRSTSVLDLNLNPNNPRQGDVGAIAESIEANGFVGSIVAQCSTGNVLAGNHRLLAAKALGMTKVQVHWVDVDDAAARRIMLADNRTSDLATYDEAALTELLADMARHDSLIGTGFDGDDLDDLLTELDHQPDWADAFGLVPPGGDGTGIQSITFTVHENDAALILAACDAYDIDSADNAIVTGSVNKRGTALAHIIADHAKR